MQLHDHHLRWQAAQQLQAGLGPGLRARGGEVRIVVSPSARAGCAADGGPPALLLVIVVVVVLVAVVEDLPVTVVTTRLFNLERNDPSVRWGIAFHPSLAIRQIEKDSPAARAGMDDPLPVPAQTGRTHQLEWCIEGADPDVPGFLHLPLVYRLESGGPLTSSGPLNNSVRINLPRRGLAKLLGRIQSSKPWASRANSDSAVELLRDPRFQFANVVTVAEDGKLESVTSGLKKEIGLNGETGTAIKELGDRRWEVSFENKNHGTKSVHVRNLVSVVPPQVAQQLQAGVNTLTRLAHGRVDPAVCGCCGTKEQLSQRFD
eukprot:gene49117-29714_t